MKEIVFSDFDIADLNINIARDLLIQSYVTSDHEKKAKGLVMAYKSIGVALQSVGVDVSELKIKKEKNNFN